MIPLPSTLRIWLAAGVTDMRLGMPGLALKVQEALGRDPFAGDVYAFRFHEEWIASRAVSECAC
ncbi:MULTISPECIES: IS66 family insertion sequence element accessory protein TnpB [Komagataeibacter]|uniref:Transposase n=4 Tax=Acetobacteraceae TaxID=433 RepID=A0A318PQ09_9PROT|nr:MULTISPECIES: IS66 family insertion sequence element accessory protein TnpB [Komagataeibacter]MCE2580589.1 IS66 family insertion sequence element accessory protein TnpB [Komagataeibacter sp. FNDCR1]PYD61342.1 hypothetical protein CFR72_14665 [Gluconacetobacter entanii]KPH87376.1 transposase [Komagataeibacter intermedius AF2]MCE2564684.1 IS66 family insertion sequence element accessory protein TnpB [Komagataeibacter sp. FNDCF1]MCE2564746.1 IS66 family insertion sequence element accessory pro